MSEKILIVDDDIDSLKLIGLMLQRHGYEVAAASSGTQALAKAATDHPDLIILDIMMPDMDGYEVCRRLRADESTSAIPVIMFTAKTLVDDKVAGFEAGADDYLTKPTHPAELTSRVKAILARTASNRRTAPVKGMTIGIIGTKGGVGTTTLALNLSAALMMAGEQPVVADFRLGCGSMGLLLGLEQTSGMLNVLSKAPTEIQPGLIEREIVTHHTGIRALLSSPQPREAQLKYLPEAAVAVINSLRMVGRPTVFDLGAGYGGLMNRLQLEMDQIILIVDPENITLKMAREILRELENTGTGAGRIHVVVVNRVPTSTQLHWSEVERTIGRELRAIISEADELIHQAVRAGVPFVMLQPNAIASSQIAKLSDDINARIRALANGQITT